MASALSPPSSSLHPQSTPMAAAPPSSTPQMTFEKVEKLRLILLTQTLKAIKNSSGRSQELVPHCISLARSIDVAIVNDVISPIASSLPVLVKQVYQHRNDTNDTSLQSAVTMLMISIKNACANGWFSKGDNDELLTMANELLGSFCMGMSINTEVSNVSTTLSKIIPRYYPQLKLGQLLVSFEAKFGYDILVSDFHIKKNKAPEETIRLFVAQTDNLETSSCLISPPQVSFLVNGKGVEGRTNNCMESGPQFPTDITKMLKRGTNIIQAAGHFSGNYIVAVAFVSKVSSTGQKLKDYVQPIIDALAPDPEIVEVSSRISLNCPISFGRIKTPIKGPLCKHRQCFDYDNFMNMNSRKPSWHCPLCNQPTSFIDLRIDQNMVKVLREVAVDITNVFIDLDGSWKVIHEHEENSDDLRDCEVGDETKNVVDLTMVENDRDSRNTSEIEDRKPFKDFQSVHISSLPTTVLHTHRDTLECLIPTNILNPVITDTFANASGNQQASTFQNVQTRPPQSGNSVSSSQTEWRLIPRQVNRVPTEIQALHPRTQDPSFWRQPFLNSSFNIPRDSPSASYERVSSSASILDGFNTNHFNSGSIIPSHPFVASHQIVSSMPAISSCDIDMQQVSHSITQNQDQGCHYSLSSAFPQVDVLPAPTQGSSRLPSNIQQVGADRVPLQSLSNHQTSLHQSLNGIGHRQTHCTNTDSSVGMLRGNLGINYRQILTSQRAASLARLQSVHPIVSTSATSPPITADNLQHVQSEQNWQPTGRMRGSLRGQQFSAVLSHYLARPSQQVPSVTTTPGSLPVMNANSTITHGSSVQQSNWNIGN